MIPEIKGLIRSLNNSKSKIPIMAMTANVLKAEVNKCFSAGMNAYISKPFNRKELIQNIANLVDQYVFTRCMSYKN